MATQVVKPITRSTFASYAALGKSNASIRERICHLLFRLVQTDNPAKVRSVCKEEIEWLESQSYKPATRASYVAAYRKAIAAYYEEHPPAKSLLATKETIKGTVVQHCALNYLFAAPEDYAQGREQTKVKSAAQRDNLTGFNAALAVDATKRAMQSDDWRELAVALIMATQSRPSDMLSGGDFKAISKYRLAFTSRAKKRGESIQGEIFCLVESTAFIDAFSRLRRTPEVMEMKSWSLKDIDSGKNATLNRAVNRIYGEIIPAPHGEESLSCKNLRAAGVNAAYWLHGRKNQSIGRFAELQLLHSSPGTAANYEDYYAADAQGDRLQKVGILKDAPLKKQPKSEKRSSVSVDAQLREMIADAEQWGEGSHADRLERIMARAMQADKIEAQLARECEKRQRAELEVKRLQSAIAKLQPSDRPSTSSSTNEERFSYGEATPTQSVSTTVDKGERSSITNSEERFSYGEAAPTQPVVTAISKKERSRPAATDDDTGVDWRAVPNEVLKDDLRKAAHKERLRRSVEAVQEYNAGRELSEQYGINTSLLRHLAGVSPKAIRPWMNEHEEELTAYANAQGHIYQQNKGKDDPRSVMKWSEAAYGEYDW